MDQKIRTIVLSDTPEGFILYYTICSGDCMPKHVARMVFEVYDAMWWEAKGLANKCFRGGLKTTIKANWFMSYQMALYPKESNLLIQDDGPKAQGNAASIASIIETNKYFKWLFPNVAPDYKKGWGAKGYEVQRTDIDYSDWRRINARRRDPSFVGAGYTFGFILGMHPTRMLIIDDINNEKNTRTARTLRTVVSTWEDKILPTTVEGLTWEIYNYTPWAPGDVGDLIEQQPDFFRCITTPICENGDLAKPIWPEKFPHKALVRLKKRHTPSSWARAYLVDPAQAEGTILSRDWLHYYPSSNIKDEWATVIGVDYASVKSIQETQGHDEFGMAVIKKIPAGGLILYDGVKQHMTQVMAEEEVYAYNDYWAPDRIGVEELGSGKEFYYILLKRAGLPLRGMKVGNKGKKERFEKVLAPLFKRGKIWIAGNEDGTGPRPGCMFLQQFIDEWVQWDGEGTYGDDAMDAVYHAAMCAKGHIIVDDPDDDEYVDRDYKGRPRKRRKNQNAYVGFIRRGK